MKQIFILLLLVFSSVNLVAEEVTKETHLYSVKGIDSLKLDRYYVKDSNPPLGEKSQKLKPAIVFVFGGAFYTGKRDYKYFVPFYEYYAKRGFEVFSIDYRLGFKATRLQSVKPLARFGKLVDSAINLAVEDLYDATNYIIRKSKQWNVNPELIVPFGSSSGAITALHAEYYLVNGHSLTSKLPKDFKYGGIISMAGSIFSKNGKISWSKKASPILMFHGNADKNVPYNKKRIFKYGFYGSESIAKSLKKVKSPYYFCTFDGEAHRIAGLPANNNRDDINDFLQKLVIERKPYEIIKVTLDMSKSKGKRRFSIRNYLEANFKPTQPLAQIME